MIDVVLLNLSYFYVTMYLFSKLANIHLPFRIISFHCTEIIRLIFIYSTEQLGTESVMLWSSRKAVTLADWRRFIHIYSEVIS